MREKREEKRGEKGKKREKKRRPRWSKVGDVIFFSFKLSKRSPSGIKGEKPKKTKNK